MEPGVYGLSFCLGAGSYICMELYFLYIIKCLLPTLSYVFQWTFSVGCSRSRFQPSISADLHRLHQPGPLPFASGWVLAKGTGQQEIRRRGRKELGYFLPYFSALLMGSCAVLAEFLLLSEHLLYLQVFIRFRIAFSTYNDSLAVTSFIIPFWPPLVLVNFVNSLY